MDEVAQVCKVVFRYPKVLVLPNTDFVGKKFEYKSRKYFFRKFVTFIWRHLHTYRLILYIHKKKKWLLTIKTHHLLKIIEKESYIRTIIII